MNDYTFDGVIKNTAHSYPNYGNVDITQESNFLINRKLLVLKQTDFFGKDVVKPFVDITFAPTQ